MGAAEKLVLQPFVFSPQVFHKENLYNQSSKNLTEHPAYRFSSSSPVSPVACIIFCTESPNRFRMRAVSSFAWRDTFARPLTSP